ncbi:MAG: late competence development ComFB family protein [Treponema sp.]|jgi:competence protein ComFB|nr:late competence development ComFB family protein [Treponema sp.]
MAFIDNYSFHLLENESVRLVINELEKQLEDAPDDMCRCNECIVDIAAKALNSVKPVYRFSLLGSIYASQSMNDKSYAISVKNAVAEAIELVTANPAHD